MKFTVLWSPSAEARLADLWAHAVDRQAVAKAADVIDVTLKHDAHNVGESRGGNRRICHEIPLGVIYSVNEADRKVLVLDVWRYSGRAPESHSG